MELELAKVLTEIVGEINPDVEVRENYSGRSMYGNTTAGIVGTTTSEIASAVITLVVEEDTYLLNKLREAGQAGPMNFREDNMGLDMIVY